MAAAPWERTSSAAGFAVRATPLSRIWPGLAPGAGTMVRLYVTAPATVKRFAIEERGLAQGELGGDFRFALSQAVTR